MRPTILFLVLLAATACSREAPPAPAARRPVTHVVAGAANIGETTVSLPKQIGDWTRPEAGRRVTAETIFDYMDGAGEFYLAYRFDHLDVFEYTPANESAGTILVEIYSMKSPDDAFGLLSTDWGGEVPPFDRARPRTGHQVASVPAGRALYGAGLLRLWCGTTYMRILASRESPESREAVLRLGGDLTADGRPAAAPMAGPPTLLEGLASSSPWLVRPDRTTFLRSHLVLNSQYFLASQDILGLGLDVEAATTEYARPGEDPIRAIVVRYPSAARAAAGVRSFTTAYLPETSGKAGRSGAVHVEKGWVGWAQKGQDLVIALDAPGEKPARDMPVTVLAALPPPGPGYK